MNRKQKDILKIVKDRMEQIETARYTSKDPIVIIDDGDTKEEVIIKLLTSERTGALLKLGKDILNPAEDVALQNFHSGIRSLNSWQFRKSLEHFNEAANKASNSILQQRVNLFKQLNSLLQGVVYTSPERSLKRTQILFDDLVSSIKKYDKLSDTEKDYYNKKIDALYNVCLELDAKNNEFLTQQLFVRSSIALANRESLAAYVWLFKTYLQNKEIFDNIALTDNILKSTLDNLKLYLEIEIGLKDHIEELPKIASAYDLQTIFGDYLTEIYDIEFMETTQLHFSFHVFKESILGESDE